MNPLLYSFLFVAVVALLAWPVGKWLTWTVRTNALDPWFTRLLGSGITRGTGWKTYFLHLLGFNAVMFALTWIILANQQHLPLNPDGMKSVPWHLVFNTTVSFVTNTNLQHYSGEATFSYLSQLTLMWLQFTSAATGIAAFVALARGVAGSRDFGNFTHDTARILFLFLIPLATIWALAYSVSGVPMTFEGSATATTLEGATQMIARGPVAGFLAIKQLGTNGGGFFGPNSTHPLENPTFFTNFISMVAIPIIPMACVTVFGALVGRARHARVIGAVMLAFLLIKVTITVIPESAPTAAFANLPVAESANLEGKELRFGAASGPLWAVLTTSTSNGSVGAMHDSLNPLSLLGPFSGLWLNSTFGGVGVGMINFFLFMILAVFVAGLMVGRTPEYLGKKVEAREMALAASTFLPRYSGVRPTIS
ncbi:MAG: potassium-transporting ATPase subunit A, partial [Verrucomicrobiaceae bacterium]